MATSGTTEFDLNIDDIIEEAYERCAIRTNSGYDLKSARRSLNLSFFIPTFNSPFLYMVL